MTYQALDCFQCYYELHTDALMQTIILLLTLTFIMLTTTHAVAPIVLLQLIMPTCQYDVYIFVQLLVYIHLYWYGQLVGQPAVPL